MLNTISIREQVAATIAPWTVERRNQLERLAFTDMLTGLANRAAFDKAENSAERDAGISFIFFDANNFGKINKECGHKEGDRVLKFYADVIKEVTKNFKARAFRYGSGDEFVILCGKKFAEKIRDAVEKRCVPVSYENFSVSISGEIGATMAEADTLLQSRKRARKLLDFVA
jgi:diguanylate cyclase (GGDEF)-like protein